MNRPIPPRERGYTMVEVMMALAILAVGAVGVISLQKVAVMGGLNARNLTSASNVANSWIDVMQGEATAWNKADNTDLSDSTNMPLINAALGGFPPTITDQWVAIPSSGAAPNPHYPRGGGTTLDGSTFACASAGACPGPLIYCSQVRARLLGDRNAADTIRVEVRTFFARNGRGIDTECDPTVVLPSAIDTAIDDPTSGTINGVSRYEYGFVNVTGTIRRNTL